MSVLNLLDPWCVLDPWCSLGVEPLCHSIYISHPGLIQTLLFATMFYMPKAECHGRVNIQYIPYTWRNASPFVNPIHSTCLIEVNVVVKTRYVQTCVLYGLYIPNRIVHPNVP